MSDVDYREELHVQRHKDQFNNPSTSPLYDWYISEIDLIENTTQVLSSGENSSIGEICQLIDNFEYSEQDIKLGIKSFLETDKYDSSRT